MDEQDKDDLNELVRLHAEADITIPEIAMLGGLAQEEVPELYKPLHENGNSDADEATPETDMPDDVTDEVLTKAYQENTSHAAETNDQWSAVSTEANNHLGGDGDDDGRTTTAKPTSLSDAEKIRIAEKWRRGEMSEDEARQQLGDETVDEMIEDREAFREAMRRDTSDFLQFE